MKEVLIECPTCNGSGKSAISHTLALTLSCLTRTKFVSTEAIYGALGTCSHQQHIGQTAINNRLNALLKMHLVEFERRGKMKFWKRTK